MAGNPEFRRLEGEITIFASIQQNSAISFAIRVITIICDMFLFNWKLKKTYFKQLASLILEHCIFSIGSSSQFLLP